MAKQTHSPSKRIPPVYTLRFTVKALGPARSEQVLRHEVETAFAHAFAAETSRTAAVAHVEATVEPVGGFLAAGLDLWLISIAIAGAKAAGAGAVAALGKRVADSVWDGFSRRVKERNILVEKVPSTDASKKTGAPHSGKRTTVRRKRKSA